MNKRLKAWGLGPTTGPTSGRPTSATPGPQTSHTQTGAPQAPANDQTPQAPQTPSQAPHPDTRQTGPTPAAPVAGGERGGTQPSPYIGGQPSAFDHFAQAAPTSSSARSFRLSTLISEEHGDLLEDMRHIIRKQTGRRPKIAEIVEAALEALENEMTGGGSS